MTLLLDGLLPRGAGGLGAQQCGIRFLGIFEQLPPGLQQLITTAARPAPPPTLGFTSKRLCTNTASAGAWFQAARAAEAGWRRGELDPGDD